MFQIQVTDFSLCSLGTSRTKISQSLLYLNLSPSLISFTILKNTLPHHHLKKNAVSLPNHILASLIIINDYTCVWD